MQYLVLILTLVTFINGAFKDLRIVGGLNTTIKKHPYQVSIRMRLYNTRYRHVCGGSLMNNLIVLTAAHCMQYESNLYSVRAGSSIRSRGGTIIYVLSYSHHPKYNASILDYDVAIVKLKKAFKFDDNIKSINLQPLVPIIKDGTFATVTGWGKLWSNGPFSKMLQKVDMAKINHFACKVNYKILKPEMEITSRMVCYSSPGKDSCQADSGGALVIGTLQVGIVSWGIDCDKIFFPGVYTNIQNEEIQSFIFSHL